MPSTGFPQAGTPPRNRLRGARPPCGSARPVGSTPRTRRRMERGVLARARARRASCRGSRAGGFVEQEHDKPKKGVSTKIGSSTAMNDRGTHQTLTRYVRRAGGVDMCLCERVWENTASQACASSSETRRVSTGRTPTCYVLRSLKKKNRDVSQRIGRPDRETGTERDEFDSRMKGLNFRLIVRASFLPGPL